MFADLKPYPAMKDSDVPWLGEVPTHWETERAKWLFRKMERPVRESHEVVTCFRDGVVTLRKNRRLRGFTESLKEFGYQGISRGDLVIHAMDAFAGAAGVSDSDGKGTSVYSVCSPSMEGVNAHYYAFCVREMARSQWILALSKGIRERSTDFRFSVFAAQIVPLPPVHEQHIIVRFLDHADRRIRRYIRAKQKLIALLEEQKQAIIHQAVTGQIDVRTGQPYPAYKPSGVPWLEKVPACWDLRPAKWYFREVDDRSETGSEELLSVSHITGVTPRSEKNITMFKAESNVGYKLCKPGDLVINTMWAWMAALGVARQAGIVSPSYAVYRPHPASRLLSDYTDLLLRTTTYKNEYICRSTGIRSSRLRLYPEEFLRIKLLSPSLEEQYAIAEFVSEKSVNVWRSIDLVRGELSFFHEYRTRLIADVVTGKLDVREAAAALPEVDPLAEDDLDGTIHDGDNSNLGELGAEESTEEYTIEKEVTV